jgi:hypothetical protein
MYITKMISVGKASNGFVIECRAPIKPDMKDDDKNMPCCVSESGEKQYIAKDAAEVVSLIEKLMPMLDDSFTTEEEFDVAFDKAAK